MLQQVIVAAIGVAVAIYAHTPGEVIGMPLRLRRVQVLLVLLR